MTEKLTIFSVSDSVGETADYMLHAVLSQFPGLDESEVTQYSFVNDMKKFEDILTLAKDTNAIVITTLVSPELNEFGEEFRQQHNISLIDYMTPLIQVIEQHTNLNALHESGAVRRLDRAYFRRIEAMEFAVKYDDGKDFDGLEAADAIIVGVSRTSKTPLTMYLANKGYKVANVPLIPEVPLPKEVLQNKSLPIFGLTASPEYIMNIRKGRVEILGLDEPSRYCNLDYIKQELSYAEEVFRSLNAIVISTEYRSIEESSYHIEKHLKHYVDF